MTDNASGKAVASVTFHGGLMWQSAEAREATPLGALLYTSPALSPEDVRRIAEKKAGEYLFGQGKESLAEVIEAAIIEALGGKNGTDQ